MTNEIKVIKEFIDWAHSQLPYYEKEIEDHATAENFCQEGRYFIGCSSTMKMVLFELNRSLKKHSVKIDDE